MNVRNSQNTINYNDVRRKASYVHSGRYNNYDNREEQNQLYEQDVYVRESGSFSGLSILLVAAIIMLLFTGTYFKKQTYNEQSERYSAKIEQLNMLMEQENQRTEALNERKNYIKTKKYVEEVAKQKFGLLYEDEIMFKAIKK